MELSTTTNLKNKTFEVNEQAMGLSVDTIIEDQTLSDRWRWKRFEQHIKGEIVGLSNNRTYIKNP